MHCTPLELFDEYNDHIGQTVYSIPLKYLRQH